MLAAAAAIAMTGLTGVMSSTAYAAPTTDEVVATDVTRQAENTPPTDNWVLYTRVAPTLTPPTAGAFVDGPGTPPAGDGSLQLTTVGSGEKVFLFNYDHAGTDLGDVDDISYYTYRQSGSAQQVAALNLQVDYNGAAPGGFTTLVFEPVYNTAQGAVVSGEWQDWIADGTGRWWSTQPINGQCAGASGPCFRTWDQIVASNPDAVITGGVGVNQGSGNPGLTSNVDAFTFDEATYDFEADADTDGVGNGSDNCRDDANTNQADLDADGAGDVCDADDDGDTVADDSDNCPTDANTNQADLDADGVGDACDSDRDGDGDENSADNCADVPNPGQENLDGDSQGDACDSDDDNDGVPDVDDTNSKADCKNDGWQRFTNPQFKNQGQCVSYFASAKS